MRIRFFLLLLILCSSFTSWARSETPLSKAMMGEKFQNPITNMANIPLQNNVNFKEGPNKDKTEYLLKIEPVIPFEFDPMYGFLLRPIFPIDLKPQQTTTGPSGAKGSGDLAIETYFTTHRLGHYIFGLGLKTYFPTASAMVLGTGKWSLGPDAALIQKIGGWMNGVLFNYFHSVAGDATRSGVSQFYFQPFLSYTWRSAWTVKVNSETYYNFKAVRETPWTAPIFLTGSKVVAVAEQPMSIGLAGGYYVKTPTGGPTWDARVVIGFLFPSKDLTH